MKDIRDIIKEALKEDIGKQDITTQSIIPHGLKAKAVIVAKENCVVCGLNVTRLAFKLQDKNIKFSPMVKDGDLVRKGQILVRLLGKARSILTAERVALNFLSLLSGISSETRAFVNAVKPYKVKVLDTRKTIPGLRELQKYAVRMGGGHNHRLSLDEMVMVKDNHIKVTRTQEHKSTSERNCFEIIKDRLPRGLSIEVEVNNLKEFKEVLGLNPDIIMLDNMTIKDMRKAVVIRNSLQPRACSQRPKLEASGGITLKNIKKIAATGVDMISIGALTHSARSVDINLEII